MISYYLASKMLLIKTLSFFVTPLKYVYYDHGEK